MASINITTLETHHDRETFDCNNDELNSFLRFNARANLKTGKSRTYVLTDEDSPSQILGYFTLLYTDLPVTNLPNGKLRGFSNNVPVILLGKLAISKDCQRQGFGHLAMNHIFRSSIDWHQIAGGGGIIVDAKDTAAAKYYQDNFGFVPSPFEPLKLFLPMKTIIGSYK